MTPEAVSSAVSQDDLEIPLIDFSAFLSGDETTKKTTAQAILTGFQKAGFIYLKNHGIPKETVQKAFSHSARFFARPEQQKLELGWTTPRANRGYSQPGREKTTDATDAAEIERIRAAEGADLKESYEIGREGEPGCPNPWPDRFDEDGVAFTRDMVRFHDLLKQLHMRIMRAIAVGLGIAEGWFDAYTDGGDNTLRLLHYPAVRADVFRKNQNTVRAGAHTDYGSITCLFQVSE
jgi:isopenicillin N synthase-like dioxygenase